MWRLLNSPNWKRENASDCLTQLMWSGNGGSHRGRLEKGCRCHGWRGRLDPDDTIAAEVNGALWQLYLHVLRSITSRLCAESCSRLKVQHNVASCIELTLRLFTPPKICLRVYLREGTAGGHGCRCAALIIPMLKRCIGASLVCKHGANVLMSQSWNNGLTLSSQFNWFFLHFNKHMPLIRQCRTSQNHRASLLLPSASSLMLSKTNAK